MKRHKLIQRLPVDAARHDALVVSAFEANMSRLSHERPGNDYQRHKCHSALPLSRAGQRFERMCEPSTPSSTLDHENGMLRALDRDWSNGRIVNVPSELAANPAPTIDIRSPHHNAETLVLRDIVIAMPYDRDASPSPTNIRLRNHASPHNPRPITQRKRLARRSDTRTGGFHLWKTGVTLST
jgi:hypothetical protein